MNQTDDPGRPVRKICANCEHCIERDDTHERGMCVCPASQNFDFMVAFDDSCRHWRRDESH